MTSETKNVIRVGSRKSELALIQTNFVIDSLKKLYPDKEFTIVSMTTLGDRVLNISLPKIGEKSLFTKDLEDALRNDSVDFVVHSLKDLPTTLPDGLAIGAVFEREDPRDALVLRDDFKDCTLATLPEGSVIGTSSLRRTAQLRGAYPQLRVSDVRGNLNTRLNKLSTSGQYAALLLASAGLHRMGWSDKISKYNVLLEKIDILIQGPSDRHWEHVLPCAEMKYAVGQGALAVECRSDNKAVLEMLAPFNHPETYCRTLAERSFLKTLGGGCSAPVGVSTSLKPLDSQFQLTITGDVWSLDGTTKLEHTLKQTFTQIKITHKHKLSPTDELECKKIKTDHRDNSIPLVLNKVSDETGKDIDTSYFSIDERIFCGFTVNSNVPIDVIMKCDNLGKDLANSLIEKGALEVMKVTQDYIRNSVVKKS